MLCRGTVTACLDYGVFLDMADHDERGFIHVSKLGRGPAKRVLEIGQEVTATVLAYDVRGIRLRLRIDRS